MITDNLFVFAFGMGAGMGLLALVYIIATIIEGTMRRKE